jgi:hypothetical protein
MIEDAIRDALRPVIPPDMVRDWPNVCERAGFVNGESTPASGVARTQAQATGPDFNDVRARATRPASRSPSSRFRNHPMRLLVAAAIAALAAATCASALALYTILTAAPAGVPNSLARGPDFGRKRFCPSR